MYRDDRLEFKKGSLLVKKTETTLDAGEDGKTVQKQRRSIKFDFSGTNYEVLTLGYLAGIEDEYKMDPNLFTKICDQAKKASGARKPAVSVVEDKFASIRLDPAFLARASLRAKISSRAIVRKETLSLGNCEETGDNCMDPEGENDEADGDFYVGDKDAGDNCKDPEGENREADGDYVGDENAGKEDQDESGDDNLALLDTERLSRDASDDNEFVTGRGGVDFEGDQTEIEEEDEEEYRDDEEDYAQTEDGSQA